MLLVNLTAKNQILVNITVNGAFYIAFSCDTHFLIKPTLRWWQITQILIVALAGAREQEL